MYNESIYESEVSKQINFTSLWPSVVCKVTESFGWNDAYDDHTLNRDTLKVLHIFTRCHMSGLFFRVIKYIFSHLGEWICLDTSFQTLPDFREVPTSIGRLPHLDKRCFGYHRSSKGTCNVNRSVSEVRKRQTVDCWNRPNKAPKWKVLLTYIGFKPFVLMVWKDLEGNATNIY